ncbi:HTH-type transcriptional regulator immR, partial [Dysosmobacter welbionis]
FPVLGVGLRHAGDRQVLSRRHAGDTAHHRNHLTLLRQEAQDRIAVLGILKNDAMYRSLTGDQLFHALPLSY